jgi:Ankyrin repeats (3 copies)
MSDKYVDYRAAVSRIPVDDDRFGSEAKSVSGSGTVPPPNTPGEPSRSDLHKDFAQAVKNLPVSAQLKLAAYNDGTPNERAEEAIRYNDLEALSLLLRAGVSIDDRTIAVAYTERNFAALRLFKSRGIDLQGPFVKFAGRAIEEGNIRDLAKLLKLGLKPTVAVLSAAIIANQEKCVKLLLENKFDPKNKIHPNMLLADCDGIPLRNLTRHVKILADHGANLNTPSLDGRALIHRACAERNLKCVKALLECGCEINRRSDGGGPPIHWLHYKSDKSEEAIAKQMKLIRLLCEHGADPAAKIDIELPLRFVLEEEVPSPVIVCLLGHGMVKDWRRYGKPQVERAAEIACSQMTLAVQSKDAALMNECACALSYLLTCEIGTVRDKCADLLAEVMCGLDCFPEKTCELAHESLRMYLERLDHDPSRRVQHYAAKYNFSDALVDGRTELWAAGLTLDSKESKSFAVKGYNVRRHALLLCDYALKWGLNPAIELVHMGAILEFVDGTRSALDLNDPADIALNQAILDAIQNVRQQATEFRRSP